MIEEALPLIRKYQEFYKVGFSALSEEGESTSSDTYRFCTELIEGGFYAAEDQKRFGAANLKLALSMK